MLDKIKRAVILSVWFFGLLLVGGVFWTAVIAPDEFRLGLLIDPGYLFVAAILAVMMLVTYAVASLAMDDAD